jgi:hypothetical protein
MAQYVLNFSFSDSHEKSSSLECQQKAIKRDLETQRQDHDKQVDQIQGEFAKTIAELESRQAEITQKLKVNNE